MTPNDRFFLLLQKSLFPDLLSLVAEDLHVIWLRYGMGTASIVYLKVQEWFGVKCYMFKMNIMHSSGQCATSFRFPLAYMGVSH